MPHISTVFLLFSKLRNIMLESALTINSKEEKGRQWRWLIYALRNFLLHDNMLRVFRSNQHFSWKFLKFYEKNTSVGVSFFHMIIKLYKDISSASISHTFVENFASYIDVKKSQKSDKSIVILLRALLWIWESDLWKRRWKNIYFITNISIYKVTDNLKFYEVSFCTYCKSSAFELSSQSSFAIISRAKQGLCFAM